MSIFEASRSQWTSRMLSITRIVAGLVFLWSGTAILFGFPRSNPPLPPLDLTSRLGIAGLLETVGGAAIMVGLFTRPVAFVLSGLMAVAYFEVHFPQSFFPQTNGGMPAVLFCFLFLYLVFAGAGPWSLDALIAQSKLGERLGHRRACTQPEPQCCAS